MNKDEAIEFAATVKLPNKPYPQMPGIDFTHDDMEAFARAAIVEAMMQADAQPASEWVGLTESERLQIVQNYCLNVGDWRQNGMSVSSAIAAALREKNAVQYSE